MSYRPASAIQRKKRPYKRPKTRNLPLRQLRDNKSIPKVHFFKRSQLIDVNGTGQNGTNYVFTLDSLQGYTDFTNLYEFYKICLIKFKVVPTYNAAFNDTTNSGNTPSAADSVSGWIYSCLDRDGQNTVSLANLVQQEDFKMSRAVAVHKRVFKPNVLTMVYESGATTAYTQKYNQWISTSDPSCPHYGLDIYFDIPLVSVDPPKRFTIHIKYYIACKGFK